MEKFNELQTKFDESKQEFELQIKSKYFIISIVFNNNVPTFKALKEELDTAQSSSQQSLAALNDSQHVIDKLNKELLELQQTQLQTSEKSLDTSELSVDRSTTLDNSDKVNDEKHSNVLKSEEKVVSLHELELNKAKEMVKKKKKKGF